MDNTELKKELLLALGLLLDTLIILSGLLFVCLGIDSFDMGLANTGTVFGIYMICLGVFLIFAGLNEASIAISKIKNIMNEQNIQKNAKEGY